MPPSRRGSVRGPSRWSSLTSPVISKSGSPGSYSTMPASAARRRPSSPSAVVGIAYSAASCRKPTFLRRDVGLVGHDDDGFGPLADFPGEGFTVLVLPGDGVVGVVDLAQGASHVGLRRADAGEHLRQFLVEVEVRRAGGPFDPPQLRSTMLASQRSISSSTKSTSSTGSWLPISTGSPSSLVLPEASTTLRMTSAVVSSSRNWFPRPRPSWAPGPARRRRAVRRGRTACRRRGSCPRRSAPRGRDRGSRCGRSSRRGSGRWL